MILRFFCGTQGIFIENCDGSISSDRNEIKENKIVENFDNGINLLNSDMAMFAHHNQISDNDENGIYLVNSDNNEIEKNDIYDDSLVFNTQEYGIYIKQSEKNIIQDHNDAYGAGIYKNKKDGILFDDCDITSDVNRNMVILNWIFDNGETGVHIKNSENAISTNSETGSNKIERSLTDSQKIGIYLEDSRSITLKENEMLKCGIWISGDNHDYWDTHEIDTSNTVNTYEVQYLKNVDLDIETIVDEDAGEVILARCNKVVIKDQEFLNEGTVGILLGFTSHSRIDANICNSNNFYGICLYKSNLCNIIYDNEVKFNCEDGIIINDVSECNMIRNNKVIDNDDNGISICDSDNNILENNDFEDNTNYGVKIVDSTQNSIFHNNFINNNDGNIQAYDNTGTNYFDNRNLCAGNGYPEGGNYWDDFETAVGTLYDDYQGEYQDESDTYGYGDGIIDQGTPSGGTNPYNLDGSAGANDEYPLLDELIDGRVQRPPIRIDTNVDFNANHGVTSGTGTSNNPFIIEGWDIDGTNHGFCLFIGNTTQYFIVRNCRLHHASGAVNKCPWYQNAGITLYNVRNGKITSYDWNNGDPHSVEIGRIINKPTICEYNAEGILITGASGDNSYNNVIYDCILRYNTNCGIYLQYSFDNIIVDNLIQNNGNAGIYLQWEAHDNEIYNNIIRDNTNYGIEINHEDPVFQNIFYYSNNNEIYHNNFINNNGGGTQAYDHQDPSFGVNTWFLDYPLGGNYWDDFDEPSENAYDDFQGINQNILNTYNLGDGIVDDGQGQGGSGKNPYYIAGQAGAQDEYPLINELIDGKIQRPPIRIDMNLDFDAMHGVIGGSGAADDPYIIENWNIDGINIRYCLYVGNTTNYFAIKNCYLHDSSGTANFPFYPNAGLVLYNTQYGLINNNIISDNYRGIYLTSGAQSNTITENMISDNTNYGIEIKGSNSDYNSIYHNNFINNNNGGTQAYDECSNNQWDNGYPSGGNFWYDWLEPDDYSGPNQDQTGSDGIVDQPYNIAGSANAKDNYPKTRYF